MATSTTQMLIFMFQWNQGVIHMQLKDITHDQSLLQPPFRGNCMNYDVGHILLSYNRCLQEMGLPGFTTDAEAKIYGSGVEPLTDAANASNLTMLEERLD